MCAGAHALVCGGTVAGIAIFLNYFPLYLIKGFTMA